MDNLIKNSLGKLLGRYDGLVLGGNDFFYTDHLSRHPLVEIVYLYGWYLKELGVDTLFIENHYIDEPIQTRGFLGELMYCGFLFGFRLIGLEFKGTLDAYKMYTGKEVVAKVTTIAYNEPERLLRLNTVVKDIVGHQKRGKWLLFCGMSHVNDGKFCKGIKTLLGVPGVGVQIGDRNSFGEKRDFVDGKYRRPTDYLITLSPPEIYSARLYVDSNVLKVMYALLYFFSGYRELKGVTRFGDLFKKEATTVYPLWYNDLASWIVEQEPSVKIPDPEKLASVVFDMTREVCSRELVKNLRTGLTEDHMNQVVDKIVLFVEKDMPYKSLLKMVFLEKKTLPLGKTKREVYSQLRKKFVKQLSRSENHLCELFLILKRLGLELPKTRLINRVF